MTRGSVRRKATEVEVAGKADMIVTLEEDVDAKTAKVAELRACRRRQSACREGLRRGCAEGRSSEHCVSGGPHSPNESGGNYEREGGTSGEPRCVEGELTRRNAEHH